MMSLHQKRCSRGFHTVAAGKVQISLTITLYTFANENMQYHPSYYAIVIFSFCGCFFFQEQHVT